MNDRDEDWLLVEFAQRGEKHAFDLLVTKYQRRFARLLVRFLKNPAEVDDVSQDALVKAYRTLPTFRGDSALYTWLYRIGINTAKNYLASAGRRWPRSTDLDASEAVNVFTRKLVENWITVVGETPPESVRFVANSIEY